MLNSYLELDCSYIRMYTHALGMDREKTVFTIFTGIRLNAFPRESLGNCNAATLEIGTKRISH